MNKTIIIANQKGGCGKSTITVSLAVELSKSHKVTVLDLDTSATSTEFLKDRSDINTITISSDRQMKRALNTDGIIIIDSAGYSDDFAIMGIFAADLIIIPTMTDEVDILGALKTFELLKSLEDDGLDLNVKILPNKINTKKLQKNVELDLTLLNKYEIIPPIKQSRFYTKAFKARKSIVELDSAPQDIKDNFKSFVKAVEDELQ